MFYSYQIQDNIFTHLFTNGDLVNNVEKTIALIDRIEKSSKFIDCYDDCRTSLLGVDMREVYNSLLDSDVNEKKLLEILYVDVLEKNILNLPSTQRCSCSEDFTLDQQALEINKYLSKYPHFIITDTTNKSNCIPIDDYRNSENFKKMFRPTSYEEETVLTFNKGKEIIEKVWGNLIRLCHKEIRILDRKVFEKWDTNYINGLRQFADVITKLNANLTLKIVTRKNNHKSLHTNRPRTQEEIRNEIKELINKYVSVKIEFILCEPTEKFDHDRFIMFDEIAAVELNRGLDSFYKDNKIEMIRVIYYYVTEVKRYFADPQRNITNNKDFYPLKNS